jgi:hypothetical protein
VNCRRFEELLFDSMDDGLDDLTAAELDAHASECERCAELRRLASGDLEDLLGPAQDLLNGILSASGVDACDAARERLAADPDSPGALDPLLELHIDRCASCGAVHRALVALRRDLPTLAELEPDPGFIADVMAATAGAPRWADWWQRLLARPRLALEGAYAGTLVLALTFVTPASAITDIPGRVMQGLRSDSEMRRTLAEGWDDISRAGADRWRALAEQVDGYTGAAPSFAEARERVETELSGWGAELSRRWQQLREWLLDPLLERIRALLSATEGPDDGHDNETGAPRPEPE